MENNRVCIGCDHAGYRLKEEVKGLLTETGYIVDDFGTFSGLSVDYPDFIHPLAESVSRGDHTTGVIICGSGNGVSMTANKYPGVRAAVCWNREITEMARLHNDANILALPARYISSELARELVKIFLTTSFEGGRHKVRVDKIDIRK